VISTGSVWAQSASAPTALTAIAAASTSTSPSVESTPSVSTQDMLAVCREKYEPLARNFCYGFGEGVYQLYKAQLGNTPDTSICFKSGAQTRDQVLDSFVAWASARTDLANQPAAGTIMLFLRQQYPCATQK
jgi:hypothetical protein